MNPKLLILLLIIAGTGLWYVLDRDMGVDAPAVTAHEGPPAPEVTFIALEGDTELPLQQLRGQWVMLNVWASWCPPCLEEFPDLIQLAEDFPGALQVVAVTTDKEAADAERFLRKNGFSVPANMFIAHDPERKVTQQMLQSYKYPESMLITPEGQMVAKFAGALSAEDLVQLRRQIAR